MQRYASPSGLWFEILAHGGLRRAGRQADVLGLFVGSEVEPPVANLWLRTPAGHWPLLGPGSPSRIHLGPDGVQAHGQAAGLRWRVALRLARDLPAWFWHVELENVGSAPQQVQLRQVQDIGLAPYGALRLNEHYASHYVDLQPLRHAARGWIVAARQNQAVDGRHPWALLGSLRRADRYATDGLQWRDAAAPLPARRLQHEHAGIALDDAALLLAPGACLRGGFFGLQLPDHAAASGAADRALVARVLAQPEAVPVFGPRRGRRPVSTLFCSSGWLQARDLTAREVDTVFGPGRRLEERIDGALASFFIGEDRHVVLRAKEAAVLRPHGHMLRGGNALVPDESALTSTAWMAGVFHSMLTQGHVSINRFMSTVHGYLGQFRSHGQRVFVRERGRWLQLGVPSAFEMEPGACRWIYRHAGGLFIVESRLVDGRMALVLQVRSGPPLTLRITHHVALGGDDGSAPGRLRLRRRGGGVFVAPPAGSELARRFPRGGFSIVPLAGCRFDRIGGDEMLHADGIARAGPWVCIDVHAARRHALAIEGHCIAEAPPADAPLAVPRLSVDGPAAEAVAQIDAVAPWFTHNALVHYLSPRGLEQYTGGGWGTRDVCQGPLELLLAAGRTAAARDLLLRTYANQDADGDWPQWFMVHARDRHIRAADAHGDIVFWPLLGLARYLLASGDGALLQAQVPFHDGGAATVWQHAQRALAVIAGRCIPGTRLAAYGHGDWNDALQPADPALRERLCSAWTVTLHHQTLATLARALQAIGRAPEARALRGQAAEVQRDFRRLLVPDGVVAGYALFPADGTPRPAQWLLHPRDRLTGLRCSLLPLMHAVLEDLLPPAAARRQIALVRRHLLGPDGARLFDAPLTYRGGPQQVFQRAESAAYFGREIGLMYTHAHLRWAQTLAHVGEAAAFFDALMQALPPGLADRVPNARPRQSNCYYSSSDAAFADRYAAARGYGRLMRGRVAVEGGWRIYSSGPGIALALLWRHVVGIEPQATQLLFDPVLPPALDGLRSQVVLEGRELEVHTRVGAVGCGPVAIELNGAPLRFARAPHHHRSGAAIVARADFERACRPGINELRITLP